MISMRSSMMQGNKLTNSRQQRRTGRMVFFEVCQRPGYYATYVARWFWEILQQSKALYPRGEWLHKISCQLIQELVRCVSADQRDGLTHPWRTEAAPELPAWQSTDLTWILLLLVLCLRHPPLFPVPSLSTLSALPPSAESSDHC